MDFPEQFEEILKSQKHVPQTQKHLQHPQRLEPLIVLQEILSSFDARILRAMTNPHNLRHNRPNAGAGPQAVFCKNSDHDFHT